MPHCKSTTIIDEIRGFFKKNDNKAINCIATLIRAVKMTDKGLGLHSACNVTRRSSDKLQLLTLFPFFNVKNPNQYAMSPLAGFAVSGKDQFYRLYNSGKINWRDLAYRIFGRLRRVMEHEGESDCPTCLIVDDTDLIKIGFHIEMIGKVFSHVTHTFNLGFKMLALCFDDGKQLLNVDFSLHGEKGRKKNYGLTDKQLKNRKQTVRDAGSPDMERVKDYYETKVDTLIGMVRRFARHGHKADYLLADSWFTCAELVRFIKRLRSVGHYLGMVKSGNTKYIVNGKEKTVKQLANSRLKRHRCRKLKIQYIQVAATLQGMPVQLFVSKRDKNDKWHALLTTNMELDFEQAYRIYARRWNIEVFFKECKQLLHLGKCQSHNFDAQIASTTISMIQYNLLSTARRFEAYETFGELFRAAGVGAAELTLAQRIWLIICRLINDIADFLGVDEDLLLRKYISDTENFTKLINLENLQQTG